MTDSDLKNNYPFYPGEDSGGLKGAISDLRVRYAETTELYIAGVSGDVENMSGIIETMSGPVGFFTGAKYGKPCAVLGPDGTPIGWVISGTSRPLKVDGPVKLDPACVVPVTHAQGTLTINGVEHPAPVVLPLEFSGLFEVSDSEIFRASHGNSQELDARGWEANRPVISINGVTTPTGRIVMVLPENITVAVASRNIVLDSVDVSYGCPYPYEQRDGAILHSEEMGLAQRLPLDPLVELWRSER